jgi:hypothetical protein
LRSSSTSATFASGRSDNAFENCTRAANDIPGPQPINTKAVITENIHDLARSHRRTVVVCAPRITLDGFGSASHGLFLSRSFVACLTTAQRRKQRRENHRATRPSGHRPNPSHLRAPGEGGCMRQVLTMGF